MNDVFVVSAFFVVLREALEATLLAGVVLAFLRRTGATQFRGAVWGGLVAGVATSVLFAAALGVLFAMRGARPFHGRAGRVFEGALFLAAAALLTWLLVWMGGARAPVRDLERSLEGLLERDDRAAAKVALFATVFLTVCREGLETVVFLVGAAESDVGFRWRGVILPAALAVAVGAASGLAIFNGLVALNLAHFLAATGTILLFFSAGLFSHAVQAFQAARVFGARSNWWNRGMWDSSPCCDDRYNEFFASLRSMFGYDDSPTFVDFVSYFAYWAAVAVVAAVQHRARLQGMRSSVAVVVRTLTLCLFFGAGLGSVFCFLHPTWNGLLASVGLWVVSAVCTVNVFDCFSKFLPLVKKSRRGTAFCMSAVTLACGVGITVFHVLQMSCEERFVAGRRCRLGRFFYMGSLFSEKWLVRPPEYSFWNAIAVLTVSLVLSVFFLITYAGSLLLFAANLDRSGTYTYRAIEPAKDITEETEVEEADITSDAALSRDNSLLYPWLSPPPSPTDLEKDTAEKEDEPGSATTTTGKTPKRVRFNLGN